MRDALVFLQRGIRIDPIDDTMLMSYVLEGGGCMATAWTNCPPCTAVAHAHHLQRRTGKGKDKLTFDCVPVAEATRYSAEDADVTLRLHMLFKPQLREKSKCCVYET